MDGRCALYSNLITAIKVSKVLALIVHPTHHHYHLNPFHLSYSIRFFNVFSTVVFGLTRERERKSCKLQNTWSECSHDLNPTTAATFNQLNCALHADYYKKNSKFHSAASLVDDDGGPPRISYPRKKKTIAQDQRLDEVVKRCHIRTEKLFSSLKMMIHSTC